MVHRYRGDGRTRSPAWPTRLTCIVIALWLLPLARASADSDCDSIDSCNEKLLENFGKFQHEAAGLDILEQNLATEEQIYASSSAADKQLAAINSQLQGNVLYYNIWNMARPDLSVLFNEGSLLSPGNNFPTGSAYQTITEQALELTGEIAGKMKTHFADDPNRASYSVYGVLPQYAGEAAGDPRPFVVSEAINGNPWTVEQTSALAVTIQQSAQVPAGFQPQYWGEYVSSPAFPSGHSTAGNTLAILTGILAPEYYKDFLMAGIEFGVSRNVFGVHYPLDVIGGRLIATYNLAMWLNGTDYGVGPADVDAASASLQAYIGSGGGSPYEAACRNNIVGCIRAGAIPSSEQFREARDLYTYYMTYGLPDFSDTGEAPVVPEGAEVLIATRFPYLSDAQRREVLATTEIASGSALDNGSGWARLNLFAAADGFGALNCGGEGADGCIQVIDLDSSAEGYGAFDVWANDMTGDGGLELVGDGILVLAGASSYSGGTSVQGGTLAITGSIVGSVEVASGALLYNAGTIGAAELVNEGAVLNDGLIEGSVLNAGIFGNNGRVTASLANSGVLFGSGSIGGDLVATADSVTAPGNSIGTIEVDGDVTLAAGATYAAELGQFGADLIAAGGSAEIEGALLDLDVAPGTILGLRQYAVLTAAGGVNGAFVLVDDPLTAYPFLDVKVDPEDDRVVVETYRSAVAFATLANTPNQIAAARSLDTAPLDSALGDAVLSLNASTAPAAFAVLAGDAGASVKSVLLNDSVFLRSAVIDRLRTAGSASAPAGMTVAPLAYAAPAAPMAGIPLKAEPAPPPAISALWAEGFGAWSTYDGNGNAGTLDSQTGGFLIGGDTLIDDWRVGLLGGYSTTQFDSGAASASGQSDNWHLGVYAGRSWEALALRTGLAYSWQQVDLSRTVILPGFAGSQSADYDAGTFQAFGELAYGIDLAMARLEPFAALAYVQLNTDAYGETGSEAALRVDGSSTQTSFTTLGLRLAAPIPLGAVAATFNGSLGWRHAFGDVVPTQTQSFLIGGLPFTVSGVPLGEDVAVVEAGLELALAPAARLNISYGGQFGDGFSQNGLSAALSVRF
ncbi:outer membrane autotransporter barrel domain-containing protein [Ancylobacter rudongensis]|uniref:Outer membrane autotransporter barrel domain-containing protein n=1 Tax=Ancylobacter rudongensis TaxID=177413 RepID=A0A1G4UFW3_9HYPH|nr:outer membrane autotransporter barrel domain-containing protein [Ancylobacter rudongensis]